MEKFGWHFQAVLVAELERIPLADAYKLSYVKFLNSLAYLKEYKAYEKEMKKINP